MSLINEALKKAERARAGGIGDTPAPEATPVIAKRRRTIGTRTLLALGGGMLLVFGGGAAALLLKTGEEAPQTPVSSKTTNVSKTESPRPAMPPAPSPAPTPAAPAIPANTPVATTPPATLTQPPAPAPAIPPIASVPVPPPPPTPTPAPAAPVVAPLPAPTSSQASASAAARPDERIADHVDRMRILGVRSPGPDARVLIGERVYRLNDVVDRTLGLRLVKVETGTLTFADTAGTLYKKNY
jgi:hypothetical protein